MEMGRLQARANSTALLTSELSLQRTMAAGRIGFGRKEGGHIFATALYAIDDEATSPLDETEGSLPVKVLPPTEWNAWVDMWSQTPDAIPLAAKVG